MNRIQITDYRCQSSEFREQRNKIEERRYKETYVQDSMILICSLFTDSYSKFQKNQFIKISNKILRRMKNIHSKLIPARLFYFIHIIIITLPPKT